MNQSEPSLAKAASIELATVLANYFDRGECFYDFGCGDGYYLSEISKRVLGRCVGVESKSQIPNKKHSWITHPVDIAQPIVLGPPGNVLCMGVAEHISRDRLPGLIKNLHEHCKKKLVLVWTLRNTGLPVASPKTRNEVLQMVLPKGFQNRDDLMKEWQKEIVDDLWWGQKQIYVFERS